MSFHLDYHPEALADEQRIVRWYRKQSQRTALRFLDALEKALDRIESNPLQYSVYLDNSRACMLRKYPYMIIYRVYSRSITIFAITHGKRKQHHWLKRLP